MNCYINSVKFDVAVQTLKEKMKKITLLIVCHFILMSQLYANESVSSEVSHVIGGALMAGGIIVAV